jgi:Fe-S-cluster-containing dehydrogenase component
MPPGDGGYCELPSKYKALLFPTLPPTTSQAPSDTVKLCEKCLSRLARGRKHVCTKTEMRANLAGILKSKSTKSRGKVVASGLKTVFDDQSVVQKDETAILQTGGTPIQVTMEV